VSWSTIRSTVQTVVASIDGISEAAAVTWADAGAAAYYRKFPRVDLSVLAVATYGEDEHRIDIDELDQRIEYVSGPRRITLTIKVESDQGGAGESMTIADAIRTGLRSRASSATFLAAEIAVADITGTQFLHYKADGRSYSVATMDVILNAAGNTVDDSEYAGETIEQASIASEYITDPDSGNNPNQISLEVSSTG
jgi:hypothetical protein